MKKVAIKKINCVVSRSCPTVYISIPVEKKFELKKKIDRYQRFCEKVLILFLMNLRKHCAFTEYENGIFLGLFWSLLGICMDYFEYAGPILLMLIQE